VAAISQTGELKKTRNVSNSSGRARVTNDPAAARLDIVICAAQLMIEPAPHAVNAKIAAKTTPSMMRSTSTRGLGPPRMPPAIAMVTATVAATLRPRTVEMRETRPADHRRDGQHKDEQRQDEPFRSGRMAVDVDGVLTGHRYDQCGVRHHDRETGQRGRRPWP